MVEIESPEVASKMAYDRAIVVFSPEGRLYQVEYAFKAVENATTVLGIVFKDGVALVAAKSVPKLLVPETAEKIIKIDEHIAIGFCGLVADARVLAEFSRVRGQVNRISYGKPISVYSLAKQIANRKQQYTQVGGIRPYGISFLISGYDDKPHLIETDPSGTIREWEAHAIGRGSKQARAVLEKDFKSGMTRDQAITLGVRAMGEGEKKINAKNVDICVVENKKFRKLDQNEMKKYF
jgi:proteasome alpha subunit